MKANKSSYNQVVLHIERAEKTWRKYPILEESATIGRSINNDLTINDPRIADFHARLCVKGTSISIEDIGSEQGVWVREQQIPAYRPVLLKSGEVFRLGTVNARLEVTADRKSRAIWLTRAIVGLLALTLLACLLFSLLKPSPLVEGPCQEPTMRVIVENGFSGQEPTPRAQVSQPTVSILTPGEVKDTLSPLLPTAPPGTPITSVNFLELPFPYDGGNVNFGGTLEQFKQAMRRNTGRVGRINSFFDHLVPLYPASNDPNIPGGSEDPDPPLGKHMVLYDGLYTSGDSYSGHPGYDFSTFEYRKSTTPLFAAADGTVMAVGIHAASGAYYVKLKHTIPGVGDYQTIYWHLEPDKYFKAMLDKKGQLITAGTRIGTMGNTGYSTGHHLHFEVRFDRDKNGSFPLGEAVDPFGYIPSIAYPKDPWKDRALITSYYLWVHSLGTEAEVPENGGGQIRQPGGTGGEFASSTLCAKAGTFPPGGRVYWSWLPDPKPTSTSAGAGEGCVISAMDKNGAPVSQFNNPVAITVNFTRINLQDIDLKTLSLYWKTLGSDEWKKLDTQIDWDHNVATAYTDRPGKCALLGSPIRDLIPPVTTIDVRGITAPSGAFYDYVTVILSASDGPKGKIAKTEYSLDGGSTWHLYTGPFRISPAGIPKPVVQDEDFLAGPPGTFAILASSVDGEGNKEDPPAYRQVAIDPSQKPKQPIAMVDITNTPTPVITAPEKKVTITPTFTLTAPPANGFTTSKEEASPCSSSVLNAQPPTASGPDQFPEGINPLTGLPVRDPANLAFAPALVSITNFPPSARPQAGLSFSPFVFEIYIGNGETRFLGLFYGDFPGGAKECMPAVPATNGPVEVGPIRSSRKPYESLRKLYSGFLITAAGDPSVITGQNCRSSIFGKDADDINSARLPIDRLKEIAEQNAACAPDRSLAGLRFDPAPPAGGTPAPMIGIAFSFLNQVTWRYDVASGAYQRFQDNADGKTFIKATDKSNGEALNYENVVMLFANHNATAETVIDIDLLYQNPTPAFLFRDGQMYKVFWTTANAKYERTTGKLRPIRFVDAQGNPFPLKPGQTWVEIVQQFTPYYESVDSTPFGMRGRVTPGSGNWAFEFYPPKVK